MPLVASKKKVPLPSLPNQQYNPNLALREAVAKEDFETPVKSKKAIINVYSFATLRKPRQSPQAELAELQVNIEMKKQKINETVQRIMRFVENRKLINKNKLEILFSLEKCENIIQMAQKAADKLSQSNSISLQQREELSGLVYQRDNLQSTINSQSEKIQNNKRYYCQKIEQLKNKMLWLTEIEHKDQFLKKQIKQDKLPIQKKIQFCRNLFQYFILKEQIAVKNSKKKAVGYKNSNFVFCLRDLQGDCLSNIPIPIILSAQIFIKKKMEHINPNYLDKLSFFSSQIQTVFNYKQFQLLFIHKDILSKEESRTDNTSSTFEGSLNQFISQNSASYNLCTSCSECLTFWQKQVEFERNSFKELNEKNEIMISTLDTFKQKK